MMRGVPAGLEVRMAGDVLGSRLGVSHAVHGRASSGPGGARSRPLRGRP
jgi:hypothetical protein